jgi:hypothetical protein
MTVKARFDGRVFVPDEPVNLPIGFVVVIPETPVEPASTEVTPLAKLAEIARMFPENPDWPEDGAAQHDHYLYGMPKRP